MGGVDNKAPPGLALTCCRDLIREFMYKTATERGEREGGRRGERGCGEGRGGGTSTNVCVRILERKTTHQKREKILNSHFKKYIQCIIEKTS